MQKEENAIEEKKKRYPHEKKIKRFSQDHAQLLLCRRKTKRTPEETQKTPGYSV
jgi:hypothetical protein